MRTTYDKKPHQRQSYKQKKGKDNSCYQPNYNEDRKQCLYIPRHNRERNSDNINEKMETLNNYQRNANKNSSYRIPKQQKYAQHSQSRSNTLNDLGQGLSRQYGYANSPTLSSFAQSGVSDRIKQIQEILGMENINLREQKDYLLGVIEKLQSKQNKYKILLNKQKQRNQQLEQQNMMIRQRYEKAREFIANGIGKMQQAIALQSTQTQCPHCAQSETSASTNQANNSYIESLNDKFDAIMFQYQKTKKPQLRKQCIQIARQLKKLRLNNNSGI